MGVSSRGFEGKILKRLTFLELYILIEQTKEKSVESYLKERMSVNEDVECVIDLPQLEFELEESYKLEEMHFGKFLKELNPIEVEINGCSCLVEFEYHVF